MATIKDTAATSALNEEQYINKLYDTAGEDQNKVLQDSYNQSNQQLSSGQESTQKLTQAYLDRTNAETPGASTYVPLSGAERTAGYQAQANLSFGNQQQKNVTQLNEQQQAADAEFERRRQLLAEQYSTAIKKAQADNDMYRAQQLYEAAKAEEAQLRQLREQGADLMAGKGDMSIWDAIAGGQAVGPDTTSDSWEGVFKNEESMSITAAYRKMERAEKDARIAELERQLAAQKQNNKNKRTSPGSQNDSGGQRKRDAFEDFMEGFN